MTFSLTDPLTFGKYKGYPVGKVIGRGYGADYIRWCLEEISWFNLDEEARDALLEAPSDRLDHLWSWLGTEDKPNLSYSDTCEGGCFI